MLNFLMDYLQEPDAQARESINLSDLHPWQDLKPGESPRSWRAVGVDPQFRAACHIPAGWIRIRFKISCDDRARAELLVDTGQGFNAAECLERIGYRGSVERDFFVNLLRSAIRFRLDPRDSEGAFRLEKFEIRPVSRLALLGHSLRNTFRTNPARLAGPAWSLVRGRLGSFKQFLLQNVPGPSALAPPPYDPDQAYENWRKQRQGKEADRKRTCDWILGQEKSPLFSIILPVADEAPELVSATIASLKKQVYSNWELVNGGRSASKGECSPLLALGVPGTPAGDYFAFLTPGDELAEHALFQVAQAIVAEPGLDMLYSDEDQIDGIGRHLNPFFKPDWSPETLRSFPYTGGLSVYRTDLVREFGFRLPEGIQEYELALGIAGRSKRIKHLADVLYHRRNPSSSAREGLPGPLAGARARTGITAKISILIPTAYQADFLLRCLESMQQRSTYPNYEILILDNNQPPPAIRDCMERWGISRVPYELPFNWARTMNHGAALAQGEHLLILDDDTEVITPDWIERLLEYSQQKEIGVVGARLQFPDGRLQHAGVTILDGVPGHPFYGYPEDHAGYFFSSVLPRNYSAVTGACLMTRTEVFRSVGGFDETFATNFNDIDFCLRVGQKGLRIVCNPLARLIHHETATKTAFLPDELAAFRKRWKQFQDPYSNPNLSSQFHDFRIAN